MPGLEPGIHAGTQRSSGTAGEGRRFFTAAHFLAVPAWILGSRSASLRLPVDDEAKGRVSLAPLLAPTNVGERCRRAAATERGFPAPRPGTSAR